jgi:hypothetical protein
MRSAIFVVLGIGGVLAAGCQPVETVTGSGKEVTREIKVADFTSVDAHGPLHVDVEPGTTFHTALTADENFIDLIQFEKSGETLHIGVVPGKSLHLHKSELKVSITMPRLESLALGGACTGRLGRFPSSPSLALECQGASTLSGALETERLSARAEGASSLKIKGTAKEVELRASGASHVDLSGLSSDRAEVELSGASNARVEPKSSLDYSISGASTLRYRGDPKIGKSESSGASSVVHR